MSFGVIGRSTRGIGRSHEGESYTAGMPFDPQKFLERQAELDRLARVSAQAMADAQARLAEEAKATMSNPR